MKIHWLKPCLVENSQPLDLKLKDKRNKAYALTNQKIKGKLKE